MGRIEMDKEAATRLVLSAVAKLEEAKKVMYRLNLPEQPLITIKNRLSVVLGQIEKAV